MNKKSVGIGVLSWKAHQTLKASLDSYAGAKFLDFFDQKIIYFSDISDEDKVIAKHYGWDYAGGPNEGIAGGMKRLAENMTTDYVLLLQNDNPLVETGEFSVQHIQEAVDLIEAGQADLARMRHRWHVGEGFAANKYLKYYSMKEAANDLKPEYHELNKPFSTLITRCLRRWLRPQNAKRFLGRSIYFEDHPEKIHRSYIQKRGDFLIVDSSILDFTDQCLLISREKWLNLFMPYVEANPSSRRPNGFQAPENCINGKWWRDSHFKILQGRGIFTHARKDGSFRPDHPSNRYSKAA